MTANATMTDVADVVDLLEALVAIDSVNPSLVAGGAGEAAMVRAVATWANAAGLHVEVLEATPGRPSVLVRSTAPDRVPPAGPTLLLCGHLDTVGTDGMVAPFGPRRDGDRLYGRGAYDMKGGLAAALVACREVGRRGLPGQVVVAAVADEEHASLGIREVLDRLDPGTVDAAIVTEPTERAVGVAHKGFVWQRIEVTGRAAHGSRPHLGTDAILALGPVLAGLRDLDDRLAADPHPLLGPGSVHASRVVGGREWSTIPGSARLDVERRTLPGERVEDVEADLAAVVRAARVDDNVSFEATTVLVREPLATAPDQPIARALTAAATTVEGSPPPVAGMSYWADSAFLAAAGIPTVLFGPDGDGAHADVEWVSITGTIAVAEALTLVTSQLDDGRPRRTATD